MKLYVVLFIFLASCTITGEVTERIDVDALRDSVDTDRVRDTADSARVRVEEIVHDEEKRDELKVDTAVRVCDEVHEQDLQQIQIEDIQDYGDFQSMISSMNTVKEEFNQETDTAFADFASTQDAYQQFTGQVQQYATVLNHYNEFMDACQNLDAEDDQAVAQVYRSGLRLGVEGAIIVSGNKAQVEMFKKVIGLCPSCTEVLPDI